MRVPDLLADLFAPEPGEIRPDSPAVRPDEIQHRRTFSPFSPHSPLPPPANNRPPPTTRADLRRLHGEIVAGCRTADVLEQADPDDLAELREADALAGFARALLADRRIRPLPAASLPPLERLALEIGDDPAELRRWLDLSAQGQRIRQRIEREPGACDRALLALRADPAGGLHAVLLDTLEGERLHAARPGR